MNNLIAMTYAELKEANIDRENDWIVRGFLRSDRLAMLAGDKKAGKSTLASHLAFCVASGKSFCGMETKQGSVLWLSYEESASERLDGCRPQDAFERLFGKHNVHFSFESPPIDTAEGIRAIREFVVAQNITLVIVDALTPAVSCDNLSEAVKARNSILPINKMRIELKVCVLLLHHTNKRQLRRTDMHRVADSTQLGAGVSQTFLMNVNKSRIGNGRTVKLSSEGRGEEAQKEWVFESPSFGVFNAATTLELVEGGGAKTQIIKSLRESDTPLTARQISQATGIKEKTVRNQVKSIVGGELVRHRPPNGRVYSYSVAVAIQGQREVA